MGRLVRVPGRALLDIIANGLPTCGGAK